MDTAKPRPGHPRDYCECRHDRAYAQQRADKTEEKR